MGVTCTLQVEVEGATCAKALKWMNIRCIQVSTMRPLQLQPSGQRVQAMRPASAEE